MKQNELSEQYKKTVLTLRRAIGILGILLPTIVAVGAVTLGDCTSIQKSISVYYNTVMRNVLISILSALAFFMFAYRGYDYKDRIVGILTFIFALGIAFFPPAGEMIINCDYIIPQLQRPGWVRFVHLASAMLFFITLSVNSFFLFTRTDSKNVIFTPEKKKRNILYRTCGLVIFGSLILITVWMWFFENKYPELEKYHPVFWLETLALAAFGISWLVKGEVALKDKNQI